MVCQYNFKMYSRLYPWLLTSDYGDDYEEDDDGYDDAGANYDRFPISHLYGSRPDLGQLRCMYPAAIY
jgi:hypothetical protein